MGLEIEALKKKIAAMAIQIGNCITSLSQVVIGVVDSIHRTFNGGKPAAPNASNTNNHKNTNSKQ